MTRPIRNIGSTPSKRPKRRVESYRILYAHILHALSLPGHPLRVTEKATHGEQMGLYSWHSRMGTSITINIVPKCEVCPRDHGKVVESLRGISISDCDACLECFQLATDYPYIIALKIMVLPFRTAR